MPDRSSSEDAGDDEECIEVDAERANVDLADGRARDAADGICKAD